MGRPALPLCGDRDMRENPNINRTNANKKIHRERILRVFPLYFGSVSFTATQYGAVKIETSVRAMHTQT